MMAKRFKPEDPDIVLERLRVEDNKGERQMKAATTLGLGLIFVGGLAVCIPIANAFAGRDTNVSIGVTLAFSFTFAATTTVTGVVAKHQHKRATTAEKRVDQLTADVRLEKEKNAAAIERVAGLVADLEGSRADNDRLRSGPA